MTEEESLQLQNRFEQLKSAKLKQKSLAEMTSIPSIPEASKEDIQRARGLSQSIEPMPAGQPLRGLTEGLPFDVREPDLLDKLIRYAPEQIGNIGGGLASRAITKNPVGSPVGSGIGAGLGRGLTDVIYSLGLRKPPAGYGRVPASLSETLQNMGISGGEAAISDVIGTLASKVIAPAKTFLTPFQKTVIPQAREANKLLQTEGAGLTAAQATKSGALDVFSGIAEGGMFSAGKMKQVYDTQDKAITNIAKKHANSFIQGASDEELGKEISDIFKGAKKAAYDAPHALYESITSKLPLKGEDIVPFSEQTTTIAGKLLKEETAKLKSAQDGNIIKTLQEILNKGNPKNTWALKNYGKSWDELAPASKKAFSNNPEIMKQIEQEGMTWQGLSSTRSVFLDKVRNILQTERGKPTGESRIYTKLADAFDKDMESFAKNQSGDVWNTYQQARNGWRTYERNYNNEIVLKLLDREPYLIAKHIDEIKTPEMWRSFKSAITDPRTGAVDQEALKKAQGAYMTNLFNKTVKVTDTLDETVKGKTISRVLKDFIRDAPDEVKKEILGKENINKINTIADTYTLIQNKQGDIGRMAIMLKNFTGTGQVAGGLLALSGVGTNYYGHPEAGYGMIAGGAAIAISPYVMVKLLTSKGGMQVLMEGMTKKSAPEQVAKLTGKIVTLAGLEKMGTPQEQTDKAFYERNKAVLTEQKYRQRMEELKKQGGLNPNQTRESP